jgi:hypothetical protein
MLPCAFTEPQQFPRKPEPTLIRHDGIQKVMTSRETGL